MSLRSVATSPLFTGVAAAALSLLVMGALTAVVGVDPTAAFQETWNADFGSELAVSATLTAAIPVTMIALGFLVAYQAGVFNLGLEGQLYVGVLAAAVVGSKLGLPAPLHLSLTILVGALGGAAWAAIPALLKLLRGVNETVSSLMLNFVAVLLASWLVTGPLKDSAAVNPQSSAIRSSAELPEVFGMPGGIVIVLAAAAGIAWLLRRTRLGFEMRSLGASRTVAERAGFDVRRLMLFSFLLSGAAAGIAGTIDLLGNQRVVTESFSPGWGFIGIAVALVGGLSPWGSILAGFFFGAVGRAGDVLQFSLAVPISFAVIVEAIAVLLVLSAGYFRQRLLAHWRSPPAEERMQRPPSQEATAR